MDGQSVTDPVRRYVLLFGLLVAGGFAVPHVEAGWFDSPATTRMKRSVAQLHPMAAGGVLLRNEYAQLFETIDDGRTWQKVGTRIRDLAVSNGDKLWAFHGWPGHHESPSASMSYSSDRGRTWEEAKFSVPDVRSDEMYSYLPATFLNAPGDDPLVLMFNLQLVRPIPGKGPNAWPKVGVPVPDGSRPFGQWYGAAAEYRGAYYVAYDSRLFMSVDGAKSWSALSVHYFVIARIKCRLDRCFALLSELGSEWAGLFTVQAGQNDWKEVGTLAIGPVKAALAQIGRNRPLVERFGPLDLLPTEQGVLIAGIVNAGPKPWGAVLRVREGSSLEAVGTSVDEGLWRLQQDAKRTIWAGGQGAFQLRGDSWQQVWSGD